MNTPSVKGVVGHSVTPNTVTQLPLRYSGTEPLLKMKKTWNTHLSSLALCSAPPRNEHKQQSWSKEETIS